MAGDANRRDVLKGGAAAGAAAAASPLLAQAGAPPANADP